MLLDSESVRTKHVAENATKCAGRELVMERHDTPHGSSGRLAPQHHVASTLPYAAADPVRVRTSSGFSERHTNHSPSNSAPIQIYYADERESRTRETYGYSEPQMIMRLE